jgi:hypothetical protein
MKLLKTIKTNLLVTVMLISSFAFSQEKELTNEYSFELKKRTNQFVIKCDLNDIKIVAEKDSKCTHCIFSWIKYDSTYANQFAVDGYNRELFSSNEIRRDFVYTVKSNIPNSYSFRIPRKLSVHIDNSEYPTYEQHKLKKHNIVIEGVEREININTLLSNIIMRNVSGPVIVSCIDGDVDIEFTPETIVGPISIRVMGGNITLRIPSTANVSINASALYGEINSDFETMQNPIQTDEKTGLKTLDTVLNKGENSISLSIASGKINILRN